MVTFNRSGDGVWTMALDESDADDRNPVYDATIPQYLTAFDPAFARALEADEAEFIKALLRIVGIQDVGWDPYETTVRAIPAMMKLHALIPPGDEWSETSLIGLKHAHTPADIEQGAIPWALRPPLSGRSRPRCVLILRSISGGPCEVAALSD